MEYLRSVHSLLMPGVWIGCDVCIHMGAVYLRLEHIMYRADGRVDRSNAGVKDFLRRVCEPLSSGSWKGVSLNGW